MGFYCDRASEHSLTAIDQFAIYYVDNGDTWMPHPAIDPREIENKMRLAFNLILNTRAKFTADQRDKDAGD